VRRIAFNLAFCACVFGLWYLLASCAAPTAVRLPDAPRVDSLRMAK
jgi:hypothetical protein